MNTEQIQINTQSSVRIEGKEIIYIDPFKITETPHDADWILITHAHFDHFDPDSIAGIRKEGTRFLAPASMEKELLGVARRGDVRFVSPGDSVQEGNMKVTAVPAYNLNKPFHPKENRWTGYVICMDGITYYAAGDTDALKELEEVQCDIALVPIGGTYTMVPSEAAGLINSIRPEIAIPMHYGSIVGRPEDADEFEALIDDGIQVVRKLFA